MHALALVDVDDGIITGVGLQNLETVDSLILAIVALIDERELHLLACIRCKVNGEALPTGAIVTGILSPHELVDEQRGRVIDDGIQLPCAVNQINATGVAVEFECAVGPDLDSGRGGSLVLT